MTVKTSIQDSFKRLVGTLPYKKISVSAICQEASISRPTFYDCFADKEAILRSIVEEDLVDPQRMLMRAIPLEQYKSRSQMSMEMVYNSLQENADFYLRINHVESGVLLTRILCDSTFSITDEILAGFGLPDDVRRYAAFFFANSNAALISKWLANGMDISPSRLTQLFNSWTMDWWQKVMPRKPEWMEDKGRRTV
jgi:AcrR family transcriptional regulator